MLALATALFLAQAPAGEPRLLAATLESPVPAAPSVGYGWEGAGTVAGLLLGGTVGGASAAPSHGGAGALSGALAGAVFGLTLGASADAGSDQAKNVLVVSCAAEAVAAGFVAVLLMALSGTG